MNGMVTKRIGWLVYVVRGLKSKKKPLIFISCDEDTSNTSLGKKFRYSGCMTYLKCQSYKALLLKKNVQQKGKEILKNSWTSTPKEKKDISRRN